MNQTHEQHTVMEPDDHFETGTLAHLVAGNEGRVLDGRRTPGYIEQYDVESAMFIWRITGFEDKGKCWEIPAEDIVSYQFRKGCPLLSQKEVDEISRQCEAFNHQLHIPKAKDALEATAKETARWEQTACAWIKQNSVFYGSERPFDFSAREGDELLFEDLENFMNAYDLIDLERITAQQYLLNPYSGEWIKAMKMVMAEMGLIEYRGAPLRKRDTFSGIGAKENRRKYILARLGFVRSIFRLKGCREVPVFRGMSSSVDFFETPQTLISTTFSLETAKDFADLNQSSPARSAYLVKYTCPVENLFMTFFETREFSQRYKEQEAVIFYDGQIRF